VPEGLVLVVDDDAVSRHVLCQALVTADLPYIAVGSGTEALQKIDQIRPALVLLDLVMPPPDGYQVLRILRSRPEIFFAAILSMRKAIPFPTWLFKRTFASTRII